MKTPRLLEACYYVRMPPRSKVYLPENKWIRGEGKQGEKRNDRLKSLWYQLRNNFDNRNKKN